MKRYVARRLASTLLMLLALSALVFAIFYVLPSGDPARARAGRGASPELVASVRHDLGIDRPVTAQYWQFVKGLVVHQDLGHSYRNGRSVRSLIGARLPATVSLAVGTLVLLMLLSTSLGFVAARRPHGPADTVLGIVSVLFTSVPIYVLGLLALYVFSSDVGALHVFDGAGTYVPVSHDAARWFKSLLLPWLTLSVALSGIYSRVLRTGLVEAMAQPHIQAARAKGLSERRILTLHAGRLAIVPYLTLLGLDIGSLLGGAVLTEVVFGIPGLGHLALESVETSDLPTTQGVVLLSGVFIIVANLVVDLAYTALDPRVRTG